MAADYGRIADDALQLTEQLCRLGSVSAEGRELDETAAFVEELLRESGFETRQLRGDDGPAAVWGEQRGRSDYTLLLYNHYDVQPVDPLDLWESPPFEPTLRDGKLFARGTSDNKAELAVRLAVVRALREEGELPIGLRWIVEGEEEVGSPNFATIVERNVDLLRADACLWEGGGAQLADGRPEIGLGFKGALFVRLHVRLLATDAHSGLAAIAPNAAWRLVEALASLRAPDGRVLIDGFYDAARAPTEAERAALAEAVSESDEQEMREVLGLAQFSDGLTGAPLLERLSYNPTCNIAGVVSGYGGPGVKTVLPAEASAGLDFRLVPDQRPHDVFELLQSHLQRHGFDDVEATLVDAADPAQTPIDHPFVERVARVAERVTGARASIFPLGPATLPIIAPLQQHVGVPGLSPPDNPVHNGSSPHAPNENIRVADLEPAVRFTEALLQDLATAR
jgi:acetylornithine deacetylase/succinyl-diaminopimelate desuccinylase-like protein